MSRKNSLHNPGEDGPWLISVAGSLYNPDTFCIYIKTPTHNRVLVRAKHEIIALDSELRAIHPSLSLPPLPLDTSAIVDHNNEQNHSIRDLFSMLYHFSPPEPDCSNTRSGSLMVTSPNGGNISASEKSTAESVFVAGYLTAISHNEVARNSKAWRQFSHARKDDLESNRVPAIDTVSNGVNGVNGHHGTHQSLTSTSKRKVELAENVKSFSQNSH